MTVFDASIKLYGWFNEHDSFCLNTDENKLMIDVDRKKYNKKEEQAAISCALGELKDLGVIADCKIEDKTIWVLKKGFDTLSQTIQLNPETCLSVASIVNGFCDIVDNHADKVDPKEVKEQDIKNLVFVSAYLMDEKAKKEE